MKATVTKVHICQNNGEKESGSQQLEAALIRQCKLMMLIHGTAKIFIKVDEVEDARYLLDSTKGMFQKYTATTKTSEGKV